MVVRSNPALRQAGSQSHPALAPKRRLPPRTRPHREQRHLLALLLIPLSFTSLTAQDTLTAGDKVRVTTEQERIIGYWVALSENGLTLNTEERDSSLVLPLASLTKLEVSRGQKSGAGKGALIGAGTGAAAGVVTAYVGCAVESSNFNCGNYTVLTILAFGAAGALVGAGIGALIGSQIKVDRWQDVPLDRIRVSLTPSGGGLEVTAKFVF